jgi:hypothetical protein
MQDRCKVYMDSYMASNGSSFMVTWIIFLNHLLEVGLTQNRDNAGNWDFINNDNRRRDMVVARGGSALLE